MDEVHQILTIKNLNNFGAKIQTEKNLTCSSDPPGQPQHGCFQVIINEVKSFAPSGWTPKVLAKAGLTCPICCNNSWACIWAMFLSAFNYLAEATGTKVGLVPLVTLVTVFCQYK